MTQPPRLSNRAALTAAATPPLTQLASPCKQHIHPLLCPHPLDPRSRQPVRTTSAVVPPATTFMMQPARTSSAVSGETANSQSTRTSAQPIDHGKFSIKKTNHPSSLKLVGSPSEDMLEIMALFRSRTRLHSPDSISDATIDHHAISTSPF